jgi:protein-tyrosine-phosphatase
MAGRMDGEGGLPALDDDPDYMRGWYAAGGDDGSGADPAEAVNLRDRLPSRDTDTSRRRRRDQRGAPAEFPSDAYMAGHMDGEAGLPFYGHGDPDYAQGWADGGGDVWNQRREWAGLRGRGDPDYAQGGDAWVDPGWPEPPRRLADGKYRVLMVCTGNTSRSALAEAAAKASRPPWLLVASAGTYAFDGGPASRKASAAALGMGLDLSGHRSSELAPGPLAAADEVWCMTRRHMDEVLALAPWSAPKLRLLDPAGDIADPHGGDIAKYRETAARVAGAVRRRVAGLRRLVVESEPDMEGERGRAAAFRVSAWWSREMLDHEVGRLDLSPDDGRRFRALCDRFLADHDWDYLHDMCYWAASFLGVACRELGIPLRVAAGRYSPEGDGFDHAWLEDASGTPFDIVAVAHAEHRRKTREGGVVGEAHVCSVCDRPSMDETQEVLADAPGCDCEDPPEPMRRTRRFADEDEAMSAGYEVVERGGFPEWVPEFVEPGRYSRDQEDEGSSALLAAPAACRSRISRTAASVSLEEPCLSPRFNVPCRTMSPGSSHPQRLPARTMLTSPLLTPNSSDSSSCGAPAARRSRIRRTSASVSLCQPCFSPRHTVPCRTMSAAFSLRVFHARLSARQFAGSPSRCAASCLGVGGGPWKAAHTRRCTWRCFPPWSVTLRWPNLSKAIGFSRRHSPSGAHLDRLQRFPSGSLLCSRPILHRLQTLPSEPTLYPSWPSTVRYSTCSFSMPPF